MWVVNAKPQSLYDIVQEVGWAPGPVWTFISCRERNFSLLQSAHIVCGLHPSFYATGTECPFSELKRLRRESQHSLPLRVNVKNVWCYTSTRQHALKRVAELVTGNTLPLPCTTVHNLSCILNGMFSDSVCPKMTRWRKQPEIR
jgi:hypothetical protein